MTPPHFCGYAVPGDRGGPAEACGKPLPCETHPVRLFTDSALFEDQIELLRDQLAHAQHEQDSDLNSLCRFAEDELKLKLPDSVGRRDVYALIQQRFDAMNADQNAAIEYLLRATAMTTPPSTAPSKLIAMAAIAAHQAKRMHDAVHEAADEVRDLRKVAVTDEALNRVASEMNASHYHAIVTVSDCLAAVRTARGKSEGSAGAVKKKHKHHSVEVLDIRGGDYRKTGEGAKGATYGETLALFRQAKRLEVPDKRASFIVDLHDPDGNLVDTAMIDARGFCLLTGRQRVPTRKETRAYDREYWQAAREIAATFRKAKR